MTARHRSRWSYSSRGPLGTWILRYKVDLLIVLVAVAAWSFAVWRYVH